MIDLIITLIFVLVMVYLVSYEQCIRIFVENSLILNKAICSDLYEYF